MVENTLMSMLNLNPLFIERIHNKQQEIQAWLNQHECCKELPLYCSVDIRNAGYKIAVIDTNLFPAGFNNLCEHALADAVTYIKKAITKRVPNCRNILIVPEEHTRNLWYLENVRVLEKIIKDAGFHVKVATFLTDEPNFCESDNYIDLKTATQDSLRIYCFKQTLKNVEAKKETFDLIIMNNDLTTGIPEVLQNSKIPIYPSIQAGWHSRQKSHHFSHTRDLMQEFAKIIDIDPWYFSCLYSVIDRIDINRDEDRTKLQETASELFTRIEAKYKEHKIEEKPYIVLKSDFGTYGMGVMAFEHPDEIVNLNRKDRNKLYKGKGSQIIDRYLLQEGVPTISTIDNQASEICIYQIENNYIGGFHRFHNEKGQRDNLNSKGMGFKKMCPHNKETDKILDVYRMLTRIASIAAHREIVQLEVEANKR